MSKRRILGDSSWADDPLIKSLQELADFCADRANNFASDAVDALELGEGCENPESFRRGYNTALRDDLARMIEDWLRISERL